MVVHERTLNVNHNEVTAAKCEPSVLHHTHVKCAIKMVSYFETVCVCVCVTYLSIHSIHVYFNLQCELWGPVVTAK